MSSHQFGTVAKFGTVQMFGAALVYALPLVSCIQMSIDPLTTAWLGYWSLFGLVVLPIMLVTFLLQRSRALPFQPGMMLLGILPNAVFFLIGSIIMFRTLRYSDQLMSSDCGRLDVALPLELTMKNTIAFHAKCVEDDPNLTEEDIVLVQSCPGYKEWVNEDEVRTANVGILRGMEGEFYCSGFCGAPTDPLWNFELYSHKSTVEKCNVPVAMRLGSFVRQAAVQLMAYSFTAVCFFGIFMMLAWRHITGNRASSPPGKMS